MKDRAEFERIAYEALDRLCAHYNLSPIKVTIKWDLKGKSTVGMAIGTGVIRLHPEAAVLCNDVYASTVVHEVCHIVTETRRRAFYRSGGDVHNARWASHGSEWRLAMSIMNENPDRLFRIPEGVALTPARKVSRHSVTCGCRTVEFTAVRFKKVGSYRCTLCGGRFAPVVKEST